MYSQLERLGHQGGEDLPDSNSHPRLSTTGTVCLPLRHGSALD